MVDVRPFKGWRFDADAAGALDQAITPPYDVISPAEREALAQNPHSFVHLILPEPADGLDKYEAARERLKSWEKQGAITQDPEPSYYLVRQTFVDLDGLQRSRRGFFATVKLPEAGEKIILGHERTFDKPVEDRLQLMEATEAQLGPVFVMYEDAQGVLEPFLRQMDERAPDISANTIDGVHQELWRVAADARVATHLKEQKLYIADGHHRFRTAGLYRDRRRQAGEQGERDYDYVLMGFIAFEDPGLVIFPPHRVVRSETSLDSERLLLNLQPWFDVTQVSRDALRDMLKAPSDETLIGLVCNRGDYFALRLKAIDRTELLGDDRHPAWRDLDVAILHRGILEHILGVPEGTEFEYEKDLDRALDAVRESRGQLSFLLRPTHPEQVRACAEAGEPMPQKSTYFFPKLPSGAVFHRFSR